MKQTPPKTKPTGRRALKIPHISINNFQRAVTNVIKKRLLRTTSAMKRVPGWIKARPQAIKTWLKQGRKKKKYRSFRLQKKLRPEPRYIPPSGRLLKDSLRFIWSNKKAFLSIIAVHAVLYTVIIRSPITTNIDTIQSTVNSVLGEGGEKTTKGVVATLGSVLSAPTTAGQSQSTTVAVSVLLMSLVYIWAIRELHAKKQIKARDAYYSGLSPLLSSVMVLIVASLQLIPFAAAAFLYTTARTSSLFVSGFEDLTFFIAAVLVGILSLYWMTSTIIAAYIITLPGMYPSQALRSAKKLVQFQRFAVFKRIFSLPIILGVSYLGLLVLVIRFASSQVFFVVELLQLIVLPLIHVYLYKLYRSLI